MSEIQDDEPWVTDADKQQLKEDSLNLGKQTAYDVGNTAMEAGDTAIKCASSGFIPINPVDWVISYIPNMALAVGIIIAVILMFICLGFLFAGNYGTAAALFIASISVGLLGYGVATALTWVPMIGGKWACRQGAGRTVINAINRAWAFGGSMKNLPVIWPLTYPLGLILQLNLAMLYVTWLPISF